jgi:hypothetical protein
MDFVPFPKIARLSRDCTITEKIDGTNASINIRLGEDPDTGKRFPFEFGLDTQVEDGGNTHFIRAGSRTRWLEHGGKGDNFGFGAWVCANAWHLVKLGEGTHFGEWWGLGIQRGYNQQRKRFSLFNTARWAPFAQSEPLVMEDKVVGSKTNYCAGLKEGQRYAPFCCDVVPVLYEGPFETARVNQALHLLTFGSVAAPGFHQPEGVIVYHHALNGYFKKTLVKDEAPKGQQ